MSFPLFLLPRNRHSAAVSFPVSDGRREIDVHIGESGADGIIAVPQHIPAEHLDVLRRKAQFLQGFHMRTMVEDLDGFLIVQFDDLLLEDLKSSP